MITIKEPSNGWKAQAVIPEFNICFASDYAVTRQSRATNHIIKAYAALPAKLLKPSNPALKRC